MVAKPAPVDANGIAKVNSTSSTSGGQRKTGTLELKFVLQVAGQDQATFSTMVDALILDVQERYDQGVCVGKCLRDLVTCPVLKASLPAMDANTTDIEKEEIMTLFKMEISQYLKDWTLMTSNLAKAYALILTSYCSKSMVHHIEEEIELDIAIRDDHVKLLQVIKLLLLM